MYARDPGTDPPAQTAFRAAEKKYQLKLVEQFRTSANGRRRGGRFVAEPVDLRDALDLSKDAANAHGATLARESTPAAFTAAFTAAGSTSTVSWYTSKLSPA